MPPLPSLPLLMCLEPHHSISLQTFRVPKSFLTCCLYNKLSVFVYVSWTARLLYPNCLHTHRLLSTPHSLTAAAGKLFACLDARTIIKHASATQKGEGGAGGVAGKL